MPSASFESMLTILRPASANVAAQAFAYRAVILAARFLQQRHRGHDLPRSAITALKRVVFQKCRLHRMKLSVFRESFNRCNLVLLVHHRKTQARIHSPPVHHHRASPALPVIASFFRSKHSQMLSQRIQQRHPRLNPQSPHLPINVQRHRHCNRRTDRLDRRLFDSNRARTRIRMQQPSSPDDNSNASQISKKRPPAKPRRFFV
jgi:hypothetical protein